MKIGILGSAHLHVHSYIKALKNDEIIITGIYDRHQLQGEKISEKYKIDFKKSIEELLETDCDTVLICSENVYHKDLAIMAMNHGKHVIVEKPMALSVSDSEMMISTAQKNNVKLMVAHPVRFSKVAQDMKTIIDQKKLGKLIAINASNHGKNPGSWFLKPEMSGGGALIDHTVHICDLVQHFFKIEPEFVTAYKEKSHDNLEVEDMGLMTVSFTNGVFMNLDTSWNRPAIYPVWGDAVMEMIFEKGYLVMDGFGRKMKVFSDEKQKIENYYYEEDMDVKMIRAMVKAIDLNEPAPVTGADGLFTVRITEAAYKSATVNKQIKL